MPSFAHRPLLCSLRSLAQTIQDDPTVGVRERRLRRDEEAAKAIHWQFEGDKIYCILVSHRDYENKTARDHTQDHFIA